MESVDFAPVCGHQLVRLPLFLIVSELLFTAPVPHRTKRAGKMMKASGEKWFKQKL